MIKSFKENKDLNDFIYSSEKTRGNYEKFYILTMEEDIKINPPFIMKIKGHKYNEIELPSINKYLAIYDNEDDIIYTENDIYKVLEYEKDLYKINRVINDIRKEVKNLNFSEVDIILTIISELKNVIYEYEKSINILNDEKLKEIIIDLSKNTKEVEENIIMKGTYLDMKTTRLLTIISLITFPILVLSGWFGTNFPKNQMIFMRWEYSYLTITIICILFLILCIYLFRNDLRILVL
tara:strand:+ start:668 stop:1378 length:711 start_codon:yes stop_codon:yes gene_type:complete